MKDEMEKFDKNNVGKIEVTITRGDKKKSEYTN